MEEGISCGMRIFSAQRVKKSFSIPCHVTPLGHIELTPGMLDLDQGDFDLGLDRMTAG
jgi:hypothetical protein